ncbi:hypothetical protein F528_0156 [Neisseria meningitidis 992008]|nr:hypothetical protein F528_0156 [Neisseria meningitidis 992008]
MKTFTVMQKSNIFRTAVSVAMLYSKSMMTAISWHTVLSAQGNGVLKTMPAPSRG